ncbi:uncharacterized protein LOC111434806 [Cucurbita moschata]|uniref:Uncharacterized protein LOC111434806 n=1 Tax=Cucurbita moschata TaxID=3662 RepID=A0A6J1EIY1_CUCMO|nr:uncharacterized protein LOC111434806 [Cucurbita moschata]
MGTLLMSYRFRCRREAGQMQKLYILVPQDFNNLDAQSSRVNESAALLRPSQRIVKPLGGDLVAVGGKVALLPILLGTADFLVHHIHAFTIHVRKRTEKKVSATTGFITGQLMMFISIYYAPLHLALGRPHTITVLALPYLLFHFFWNNHKHFFDYGSTTRNSMRNLSIQCVFLSNLIFQLFNHFILPSSMLVRLVNISMFRCNNKMLFVTSSFVGWLIGHILFMK